MQMKKEYQTPMFVVERLKMLSSTLVEATGSEIGGPGNGFDAKATYGFWADDDDDEEE